MSANGISHLQYKADRQQQKLELAAIDRAATGRRSTLVISELPTVYAPGDNDTRHVIDNPNVGGLVIGRPWIGISPADFDFFNPPSSSTAWNDTVNSVTATINGSYTYDSSYGGGIVLDGSTTYIEINKTLSDSSFTISLAADFEPVSSFWNPIYHGGDWGTNDVFAYVFYTGSINVGTSVSNDNPGGSPTITGIAWWDFVYDGTAVNLYKNGVLLLTTALSSPNTGFTKNLLVGTRYDSNTDFLNGTIYRIKCSSSALSQLDITTQFNSVSSTYGL